MSLTDRVLGDRQRLAYIASQAADARLNVELETEGMTLNIGPQHPATHGTLRIIARLDGERIVGNIRLDDHAHVRDRIRDSSEHLHPSCPTGVALSNRGVALWRWFGGIVFTPTIGRWHPVDCRQEAEVVEAERVAQRSHRRFPCVGANPQPKIVLMKGVDKSITECGFHFGNRGDARLCLGCGAHE